MDERKKAEEILHRKKAVELLEMAHQHLKNTASWVDPACLSRSERPRSTLGRRSVVYRGRRCGPGDHNAGRQCDS